MSVPGPTLVFDFAIALLIACVPLYALWLRRNWGSLASAGPHALAILTLGTAWAVVAYGSFIEPRLLAVRMYPPLTLGDSGRKLRLAVISDTHLGYYKHRAWAEKVVAKTNAAKPDLIILAGDLVSGSAGLDDLPAFAGFRSTYGVFAVLGNWDYRVGAVDVRKAVEGYTVEVLTNESAPIAVGGRTVRLIGLDDLTLGAPDWDRAFAEAKPGEIKIVAVHNPDGSRQAEVAGADLVLAGHTHCGQIRLPFLGPVPPLPTTLGRHFDCGYFPFGQTRLFITPGVGESGPRSRLFDAPEISVLDLNI